MCCDAGIVYASSQRHAPFQVFVRKKDRVTLIDAENEKRKEEERRREEERKREEKKRESARVRQQYRHSVIQRAFS